MDEALRQLLVGQEAYVVGGAIRDRLLGRPVVDVDVACVAPEEAARRYRTLVGGALFPLSERHGAWRVALESVTVDFTPLRETLADDLGSRDFTVNALAEPVAGGEIVDLHGGLEDARDRVLRAVSEHVFRDDPLRLLRAVRLEDELGLGLEPMTETLLRRDAPLVTRPAGERVLGELERLSRSGWLRLEELGLLGELGGSAERVERLPEKTGPDLLLVAALGPALERLPISNERRRLCGILLSATPPADDSPREIHRFLVRSGRWPLEALAYLGATDVEPQVRAALAAWPSSPLLRGDELGLPAGPLIGAILARIAEERAAGTVATKEDALRLARELAATNGSGR